MNNRHKLLLFIKKTQYLLQDTFSQTLAAGSVNGTQADIGGARTVTDTNGKISLVGGVLNFATGGVSNDGITYPTISRIAGRVLMGDIVTPDLNTATYLLGNAGADTFRLNGGGAGAIGIVANGTATLIVGSVAISTAYKLAIVFRTNGTFYFIKGAAFTNWTLLWHYPIGVTSIVTRVYIQSTTLNATADNIRIPQSLFLPTPLAYDTFTRSNGALGSTETTGPDSQGVPALAWTGSTYAISGNVAVNTPATLGSELVTNGGFGTDTSGWAANNTATLSSVAGGQSGNALQVLNGAASSGYASQQVTTVVGTFYAMSVYIKNGTVSGKINLGTSLGGVQYNGHSEGSSGSFTPRYRTVLATSTALFIGLQVNSSVLNDTILFDSVTVKALTLSELFASLSTSTMDVIADVNVTMSSAASNTDAGVVINLDSTSNPQNFVLAYIDTDSAKLVKCVAGVYTIVINAGITYSAGATLRVIKDGTNYQLFYNNVKVGSTSTISDAGIISNTLHGLFSTNSVNTLANFTLMPRGTNNEYNVLSAF